MKKTVILAIIFSASFFAQGNEHEIKSEVKELSEFHKVIYQIWHTAWPEKNVNMLSSLLPEVEEGYSRIKKAELPGILRDKKDKWNEGIKKLSESVELYKNSVSKKDSVEILNAAEKLHMNYEMLVRVIRPVLKEVDAFHQSLYMLYHYYLPDYNFEKIKSSAVEMKSKMEKLMAVKLPERLKKKNENFEKAKKELNDAVNKLNEVVQKNNEKQTVVAAVDLVHAKYEEMEKVFN